jgi:23S rRNA (uracil1939-C5)-methyltransferase
MSSLERNSDIVLTIEKPVAGGRMLARHEGQVVFVVGAIPGERVRARVERVSRQLAYAETVEVIERSQDRRDANIDLACGGSLYAHIAYDRQCLLKGELVADALRRIGKIELPAAVSVVASPEQGYRMRARLHVRHGRIGFFREGTHELCDAAASRQLLPATTEALAQLAAALATQGATSVLSYEVCENIAATERAVLVEYDSSGGQIKGVSEIEGITGVAYGTHTSSTPKAGYGSPYVTDRIDVSGAPVVLTHHVRSFFQGNRWLLPTLAERVVAQVPAGRVIDLYAGVGLFAISLAAAGRRDVVAVEGDRFSASDLDANARPFAGALSVEHESVEQYLESRRARAPETLVLDPPRTGASPEAMSGLLALKAPRIVYVSCDAATLARDAKKCLEAGYRLDHVEAFDLFPNTAHVEILIVLVR